MQLHRKLADVRRQGSPSPEHAGRRGHGGYYDDRQPHALGPPHREVHGMTREEIERMERNRIKPSPYDSKFIPVTPGAYPLSREDEIAMLKIGVGARSQDAAIMPQLELERHDSNKGSDILFKFAFFKTPNSLGRGTVVPRVFFFIARFFTFESRKSEIARIREAEGETGLRPAEQYFLEKVTSESGVRSSVEEADLATLRYEVNPARSGIDDEHE